MIAAITLKVLDPFGTGKIVLFQVTYDKVSISKLTETTFSIFPLYQDWRAFELVPFILLGVFGVNSFFYRELQTHVVPRVYMVFVSVS